MNRFILSATAAAALAFAAGSAAAGDASLDSHEVKHVLLISVDGLHALDLSNFIATHADSTLTTSTRVARLMNNRFFAESIVR